MGWRRCGESLDADHDLSQIPAHPQEDMNHAV